MLTSEDITDDMVDAVEEAVGMGNQAWDMTNPKEIIAVVVNIATAPEWSSDMTRPGTAILAYTDQGPNGPCAQSMSVTCPKLAIHVFPHEDAMRSWCEENQSSLTSGKRAEVRYLIVGEGGSLGMSLNVHPALAARGIDTEEEQ